MGKSLICNLIINKIIFSKIKILINNKGLIHMLNHLILECKI